MRRLAIACVSLCCLGVVSSAAKDFGQIPHGRMISCAEAVNYRDQVLIKEYDAIVARYDDGTADRQKRLEAKLEAELKQLDQKWTQASPILHKKIAAQWVAITLSLVGTATGEWAAARASAENKAAVQILVDRATNASSTITTSVMGGELSTTDVALLPISAIVVVAFPPGALGITILSIGLAAIDQYENYADFYLQQSDYSASADILKNALRTLARKSVTNQLQALNKVKNEIDAACSSK